MVTTEQIELAHSLVGKKVRFRHDPPDIEPRKVIEATSDGMIEIEGFGGQFSPYLFTVVEPPAAPAQAEGVRMSDTQSWDEWAASEDGEDCLNICTLESAKSQDDFARYLRNRLKTAYEAGYLAAIKYAGAEVERHRGTTEQA